jgi:hypothetical protein
MALLFAQRSLDHQEDVAFGWAVGLIRMPW